jgi:hypothetical protein
MRKWRKNEIAKYEGEIPNIIKDIKEGRDVAATIFGYGYTFPNEIKRFYEYLLQTGRNELAKKIKFEFLFISIEDLK